MKWVYYKSKDGLYIGDSYCTSYSGRQKIQVGTYRVNGLSLQSTYHPSWYFLQIEEITKVEKKVPVKRIRKSYILKDASLQNDKIPLELSFEEVDEAYDDDDYEYYWRNEAYKALRSLYEVIYEEVPETWEEIEVELEYLGEVDIQNKDHFPTMKISLYKDNQWKHKGVKEIDISSVVTYSELEQMLTPDLMIHTRPCSITSKQTYDIVRKYVKDNIDPKWATVTSDYNFCFTVKKKVSIRPYVQQWEETKANGRSYARPRIKSRSIEYKEVEIFEMTPEADKYRGYTPIKGFKGESLEDLIENVKLYLDELMFYINQPLSECPECEGTGHVFDDKFKVNEGR